MKYTVVSADGVATEHEASPAMAASFKKLVEWDGWCRCEKPEPGEVIERGHSADLMCRTCAGCLSVG